MNMRSQSFKSKISKTAGIAALISAIGLCLANPNTVKAEMISKSITVGNNVVQTMLNYSAASVTGTTIYLGGPGTISVKTTAYFYNTSKPAYTGNKTSKSSDVTTPTGVSTTVNAPSGYRCYAAESLHKYSINSNNTSGSHINEWNIE